MAFFCWFDRNVFGKYGSTGVLYELNNHYFSTIKYVICAFMCLQQPMACIAANKTVHTETEGILFWHTVRELMRQLFRLI